MADSPVAIVASWLPSPLKDDAPTFVPAPTRGSVAAAC